MKKAKSKLYNKGQVVIIGTVLFLLVSLSSVLLASSSVVREVKMVRAFDRSTASYAIAESLNEDLVYRLSQGMNVSASETLTLDGNSATGTVISLAGGGKRVTTTGNVSDITRRVETELELGSGAAFNFGIQSGEGGIAMFNTASVKGNAFSNGPVTGANSNIVRGEVISAGPTGMVDGVHATGSIYSHSIKNSEIEGNAYYWTEFTGNTCDSPGCTPFPNSVDQATSALPIDDEQIDEWKAEAEAGGVISTPCPYVINGVQTIGPVKIECDLEITQSSADVTLTGHVWVEGNFITEVGQPTIRIDSSLGNKSVVLVADNQSDRITSSKVELKNAASFENSGTEGSFILLVSQNESAENGGSEVAVDITQSAEGDFLVYAAHGEIAIAQSAGLKEVTGYKITLSQSAEIIYESGLASLLFTSGPGGGYDILNWEEIE